MLKFDFLKNKNLSEEEKELLFNQKMKDLDEKVKLKKQKKLDKYKKRARFLEEHKYIRYIWYFIRFLTIILFIYFIYFITNTGISLYDDYNNSVKWTRITGPKLADQEPELIYALDEDKELKLKISDLMLKIWNFENNSFNAGVTQNDIDDLSYYYDKATEPKSYLTKKYNLIMDFWKIESELNSLFTDDSRSTIKVDVNLQSISDKINFIWPIINDYLVRDGVYLQAEIYRDEIYKLTNDSATYSYLISQVNDHYIFSITDNKLNIKTNILSSELVDLEDYVNMLSYKYELVSKFIYPVMTSSRAAADKNSENRRNFENYTLDIESNQKFNDYILKYNQSINDINTKIIDYKDFKGLMLSELQNWASENDINIVINRVSSTEVENSILRQSPTYNDYKKIIKGSTVTVDVAKKPETSTSSSLNNNQNSTSSSSSSGSSSISSTSSSSSGSRTNSTTSTELPTNTNSSTSRP